jgi:chemotaxis protein methyltransferase CheR
VQLVTDISAEEMNSLTESILARYGIDFTCYEPKSLRRRIIRALNLFNLASVHELWVRLLSDSKFIQVFTNEISVGMTSMFRDPILWINLKKRISKDYRHRESVSIWHAGCSTGEEVYTLGILLQETYLQDKAKAYATDINMKAIEEAKNGVYTKIKMIENETNYREYNPNKDFPIYFSTSGKDAVMNAQLVSHASFAYHNLITDSFPSGFDMILCRNVMIYFDAAAKTKLLSKFYDAHKPDGYLIVGFFDTMSYLIDTNKFKLVDDEAGIFQKVG